MLLVMLGCSAEINLKEELEGLRRSPEWDRDFARKVLKRYQDFQVMLRQMKANTRIPEHHNPGRISIQTVLGPFACMPTIRCLNCLKMLVLDRAMTHDVEAVEESAFLLAVACPESQWH